MLPAKTDKKNTIGQWLENAEHHIASATPRLDAELLLSHYLGKNRAYLLAFADEELPTEIYPTLSQALKRLVKGEPLAYVLGEKSFWDMTLKVTEDTLIPRADTETLIELCQQLLPADFNGKILDLGTGSGAIAIALSRVFPEAELTATDNSQAALSIAKTNADRWQGSPITFVYANWFLLLGEDLPHVVFPPNSFDLIISNPPYIEENDPHLADLTYEPITALTAQDNGLADIKNIIQDADKYLNNGGYLLLEHGYDQGQNIRQLFKQSPHWQAIQTARDLGNNERVTLAQYQMLKQ